ncbi:ABC-three component system middle component 7 [Limnobacter profundi]|uniref:ABC-three component system middle component 7 n=1 Tax=Limnobacter profundi TaxID=2732163 RepID=UPI0035303FA4
MLVPSKFTRLEESTIFKMKCILDNRKQNESITEIYSRTKEVFYDASEFIHALDILYVLGLLEIRENTTVIEYA